MNSLVIEASAGSGKTFQLSNRFLALLALGASSSDLIALTFTRKAAGEFTRRILSRLAKGASSEEDAKQLASELQATITGDPKSGQPGLVAASQAPKLTMALFQELLQSLIQELDRLQLSTLDSFFVRLTRAFGPELGIIGFEMLDEFAHEREREKILAEVLTSNQVDGRKKELFLKSFDVATYGKDDIKVAEAMMDFVRKYHEHYLQCPSGGAWENPDEIWPDFAEWPPFQPDELLALQQEFETSIDGHNFGHGGFSNTVKAFAAEIHLYQPGKPIPSKLDKLFEWCGSCRQGDRLSVVKYNKEMDFSPCISRLCLELRDLIVHSEIRIAIKRTQGIWAVAAAFEDQYDSKSRRQGRMGFSDVALLLQRYSLLAELCGYNELAYRLDSRFHHWMLDEFQDTSRQQWEVIRPVIGEAVNDPDGERSLFVVGDTKQAIYGWRNGEPRLLAEMQRDWQTLQSWTMSRSYRSSQTILDFANLVFNPQGESMKALFPAAALERWHFEKHEAAKDLTGCAEVYEIPKIEEPEAAPTHLATHAKLKEINPLDRGCSCAILVSSNKQVHTLANFLRSKSWPVETEATVPIIEDSPLGLALQDWFRFLVHPADHFARNHVEYSPLGAILMNDTDKEKQNLHVYWALYRKEISEQGLARHLQKIAKALNGSVGLGDFQSLRLQQILDAAHEFDAHGGSLEDWLATLKNLTRKESSKNGTIRIMTVHKSKGLEFDLVILPELSSSSFDDINKAPLLVEEDAQNLPIRYLLRPNKSVIGADSKLSDLRDQWVVDNSFERFCNLYVAITRAARHLIAFLPERSQSQQDDTHKANPANWIRLAVGDIEAEEVTLDTGDHSIAARRLFLEGDPSWHEQVSPTHESPREAPVSSATLSQPKPRPGRASATDAKSASDQSRKGLNRDARQAMAFGNEVHQLFEQIYRYDPAKTQLPDSPAGRTVATCLQSPEMAEVFNPPTNTQILLEQPIEAIEANGIWFSGVIDRLLIDRASDGTPTAARIIDFKTDKIDQPNELRQRYQGQLEAYQKHIAQCLQLPIENVTTHLLSTKLVALV